MGSGLHLFINMRSKTTMQILEAIHDAVQLGNKLHQDIDTPKIPKKEQENIKYLGQCLRSMDFILTDERDRKSTE